MKTGLPGRVAARTLALTMRFPWFSERRLAGFGGATAGMALGVAAYAFFAGQDASIKWLVSGLGHVAVPVWQVLFVRSVFIVGVSVVAGRRRMLSRALHTPLKAKLVWRASITLAAWLCYYSAARSLPLAQLLTLYFAAPIIATMLAGPLLGELVPVTRWISVGIGFCGVVVACNPLGLHISPATGLVLVAATLWGLAIILMRQIARRESSLLQMFYTNGLFLIATGIACALHWQPLDWVQVALLTLVCLFGAIGQFCLFEAAPRAPASVMATVEYSALVWAFVLGFAVFGDIPPLPVFAGAALIMAAGACLVLTERRRAVRV